MVTRKTKAKGSCIICGRNSGKIVCEENGYQGLLCACGAIFICPEPSEQETNPRLDLHPEPYYSLPAKTRINWVEKHSCGNKYLDIGAGNGATVAEAKSRGFLVSAIDPNPVCVEFLTANFSIPVELSTIETTQLRTDSFDVAFHVDLLSHFKDPVLALKKMASLVEPESGIVCFEVGLFGGLSGKWQSWTGRPGFPQHRWFFSEANISVLLTKANLELIELKHYNVSLSTVLSSVLFKLMPASLRFRPRSTALNAEKPSFVRKIYLYLHFILRYKIGALLPKFGPGTALVAARRSMR